MDDSVKPVVEALSISKKVIGPDGELQILSDITLQVYSGEAVAILGASGSGKSTLLGLLAGLDTPSSGRVDLLGQPLADLDEDGRARLRAGRVGFVFQSFQLLPNLTALENVMLPLELGGRRQAQQEAIAFLQEVGLSERLRHYPKQLSGGEQQRVAIARAFATRPAVLFADEPTGNLDQKTGGKIIELIFSLQQRYNITLLLVTHDHALAMRCGRHIYLAAGRLLEKDDVQM